MAHYDDVAEKIFQGDTVRRVHQLDVCPEMWGGGTALFTVSHVSGDIIQLKGYSPRWNIENFEKVDPLEQLALLRSAPPSPAHVHPACKPMLLATDAQVRKDTPITSGVLDYFPRAIAEVARCSKAGNDQHNPGQPLHWAKEKSTDHVDCIARHLIDRETYDTDGVRHAAKLAWRALAYLETLLEKEEKK